MVNEKSRVETVCPLCLPSLEERDVENGRIEVDELKEVHFDCERPLVLAVRLVILCKCRGCIECVVHDFEHFECGCSYQGR